MTTTTTTTLGMADPIRNWDVMVNKELPFDTQQKKHTMDDYDIYIPNVFVVFFYSTVNV